MAYIPGVSGYLMAQQNARANDSANLAQVQGILGMQAAQEQLANAREMRPLQLEQLRLAMEEKRKNMAMRQMLLQSLGGGQSAGVPAGAPSGGATPSGMRSPMGIDPLTAGLLLSGDPGMSKLGGVLADRSKPLAAREGAPVINPQTGEIIFYAPKLEPGMQPQYSGGQITGANNIPGYTQAMADRTRATEGARGEFDLVQVPTAEGGTQMMPRTAAVRALTPPALAGRPQAEIDAIEQVRRADAQGIPMSVTVPATQGIPTSQVVPALGRTKPEAVKEAEKATAKGRAESGVKFEDAVLDAGRAARGTLTQLQILAPNLDKLPTGPLYPMMVNASSYFQQFGINVGQLGETLGPAQASKAILNQLALKLRNPAGGEGMPGALSDKDREFLIASVPGLDRSPEGNRGLFAIMMAIEQRKVNEAQIVANMQKDGKSSNEIRQALSQYANTHSIADQLRVR